MQKITIIGHCLKLFGNFNFKPRHFPAFMAKMDITFSLLRLFHFLYKTVFVSVEKERNAWTILFKYETFVVAQRTLKS